MSDENRRLTEFVHDDAGEDERDEVGTEADAADAQAVRSDDTDLTLAGTEAEDSGDASGDRERTTDDQGVANGDPTDVAPAVSTATWRPDGAPCDACGSIVQRRWRDDAAMVCVDCVEW